MGRMGRRGRVVLRRIEERVRRGICFRKRLAGLEKKAEELAVLCDAHVGFVVLSCSDGGLHHFAAPGTIENIMEPYENSLAAKKGAHGRRILEKSKSKDFQIPKETTDKGLNNGVMRFIDETDISTLNMDQLSQIERLLEDELRWTRARKLEADIIARSQKKVHGKAAIDESSSTEIPSRKEKKQVDGSQQSGEEVEVVVVSQSPTPATGGGGAPEQRHWTPVDLNIPCRDAGPLQ